jgi:hypothetical protein
MIRVLPGIHIERPTDFSRLVQQPYQFITFFPLGAACHRKIVSVVASEPIPSYSQSWPVFRNSHRTRDGKRVPPWFFWDGVKKWRANELLPDQRSFPPLGVWNDTLLIDRIVAGWRHEDDV